MLNKHINELIDTESQEEAEIVLCNILKYLDKNGIPFLREEGTIPVLWTNGIYDSLKRQYTDTLSSPAMIQMRGILTNVSLLNKEKNDLWKTIYEGSLDQNSCNLFTRISSNIYTKFITANKNLLRNLELLDNDCICKLEHILIKDELPILLDFVAKYKGKKEKIKFLFQSLTITSRSLLKNPSELQLKSDKDKYITITTQVKDVSYTNSNFDLKIRLRQADYQIYKKKTDSGSLSRENEDKLNNSWIERVEKWKSDFTPSMESKL